MKALLLAGGKGTRLWPLSQSHTPKQVLSPFGEEKNLLQMTIDRTLEVGFQKKDLFLVTAEEQQKILKPFWDENQFNPIIAEPNAQNTGPAILLATKKLMELQIEEEEAIYVFPSDHYIVDFKPDLNLCLHDIVLCFRIIPTRAEPGYGYMYAHTGGILRKVRSFTEKPDLATAQKWYESWSKDPEGSQEEKYFWNAGIYAFSLRSLAMALEKIDPSLYQFWKNSSYQTLLQEYHTLPKLPFDKLIAEKAHNLYCAPLNALTWRDVGTWQSIYEALAQDPQNIHIGKGQLITTSDTRSCLISSDKNINIACAGVEDLAIIVHGDNILITKKSNPSAMTELIQNLQQNYSELI